MRPRSTVEEFERSPSGGYYVGTNFVFWQRDEDLDGFAVWGKPSTESIETVCRLLDTGLVRPHFSLIDVRAAEGVDFRAFDALYRGVSSRQQGFAKTVRKQAILRPDGAIGAIVLGFYGLIEPRYPVQHFTSVVEAFDWFDLPRREIALRDYEAMRSEVFGEPELVARLKAVLSASGGRRSPDGLARAMNLSRRTLERRLQSLGTSIREEVNAFRVAKAKAVLATTDASLLAVADAVGFDSERTFYEVFRRRTGDSPGAFRARARAAEVSRPARDD